MKSRTGMRFTIFQADRRDLNQWPLEITIEAAFTGDRHKGAERWPSGEALG